MQKVQEHKAHTGQTLSAAQTQDYNWHVCYTNPQDHCCGIPTTSSTITPAQIHMPADAVDVGADRILHISLQGQVPKRLREGSSLHSVAASCCIESVRPSAERTAAISAWTQRTPRQVCWPVLTGRWCGASAAGHWQKVKSPAEHVQSGAADTHKLNQTTQNPKNATHDTHCMHCVQTSMAY